VFCAAQACSGSYKSVEHRLKIESRAADDLQHLGGRGLLVQCLGQLVRALLLGIEEAHVLDCDHRLVSECLQQSYVGAGEWSDLLTGNGDCSNRIPVTQHRHGQYAAITHRLGESETKSAVAGIDQHIRNMHCGAAHDCASRSRLLVSLSWKTPREDLQPLRRKTMTRTKTEDLFIEAHHERELAMAQPHRSFGDGIKDRLDVRR